MTITCRDLVDRLSDYTSSELTPECRTLVEQHLRDCPSCRACLQSYALVLKLARSLPELPLPVSLGRRVALLTCPTATTHN